MFKPSNPLSPNQQHVLALLASGSTLQAAADEVGVHRNTIANWRRSDTAFRSAWAVMQYEQSMHWRDAANELAPSAIQTIREILTNETAPPSSRLQAALAIYRMASQSAPLQPELKKQARTSSLLDWDSILSSFPEAKNYGDEEEDEEDNEDEDSEELEGDRADEDLPALDHGDPAETLVHKGVRHEKNSAKTHNFAQKCTIGNQGQSSTAGATRSKPAG